VQIETEQKKVDAAEIKEAYKQGLGIGRGIPFP
jgi:hypothetical protein